MLAVVAGGRKGVPLIPHLLVDYPVPEPRLQTQSPCRDPLLFPLTPLRIAEGVASNELHILVLRIRDALIDMHPRSRQR